MMRIVSCPIVSVANIVIAATIVFTATIVIAAIISISQNSFSQSTDGGVIQPHAYEMQQTWLDMNYWLDVMLNHYQYSYEEATVVTGMTIEEVKQRARKLSTTNIQSESEGMRVLPYPGGRHPRIGCLEGAVEPIRSTKAGIFLPWDNESYLVVDLPEAIFSHQGLIFLAHTHIPTIWGDISKKMVFADWRRGEQGQLSQAWGLPNDVAFGASLFPKKDHVDMELWLRNGLDTTLRDLRTQVCIMLKGAPAFDALTNDNKRFVENAAAVESDNGKWVITAWKPCGRTWGNEDVPCLHADPVFDDCPPGKTVKAIGRIWFYAGDDVYGELEKADLLFE